MIKITSTYKKWEPANDSRQGYEREFVEELWVDGFATAGGAIQDALSRSRESWGLPKSIHIDPNSPPPFPPALGRYRTTEQV